MKMDWRDECKQRDVVRQQLPELMVAGCDSVCLCSRFRFRTKELRLQLNSNIIRCMRTDCNAIHFDALFLHPGKRCESGVCGS